MNEWMKIIKFEKCFEHDIKIDEIQIEILYFSVEEIKERKKLKLAELMYFQYLFT